MSLKKNLDKKEEIIQFYQGNVYFMSIGRNVGYESLGKNDLFLRPILVYKKLSKTTFLGISLTSKEKEGTYYYSFLTLMLVDHQMFFFFLYKRCH